MASLRSLIRARDEWVLGLCRACLRANYVEPHGTTAECACTPRGAWQDHAPIPNQYRRGEHVLLPPRRDRRITA